MNEIHAIELRRCIYSLTGQLEAICDSLPQCSEGMVLRAIIEGGMPEMTNLADKVVGDNHAPEKSCARGYQVSVLSIREERSGERDPEAWQQDPDEFMAELREANRV